MCLACEQDEIWFAYLERQGLLKSDDPSAVEEFFAATPEQPLPVKAEWDAPTPEAPATATRQNAPKRTAKTSAPNPFSCDAPTTK